MNSAHFDFAQSKKGFTLVELMVAISIVAVLAIVGLVIYTQSNKSARDSKKRSDIIEIQKALEQYYAINKNYPPDLSGIASYFQGGSAPTPSSTTSYKYFYKTPDATTCNEEKYLLCTPNELEQPGSYATRATLPSNPCTENAGTPGTGNSYFCVGSLSN